MTNSTLNDLQTYIIAIRGTGGEFTISWISADAGEYWSTQSHENLIMHLTFPEDEDIGPSDERYRLPDYRDNANILVSGLDEIEKVTVYSESGKQLMGRHGEGLHIEAADSIQMNDPNDQNKRVLSTRTIDAGHMTYVVRTTGAFDFDKLSFKKIMIEGDWVINEAFYEGEVLDSNDDYFEDLGELEAKIARG